MLHYTDRTDKIFILTLDNVLAEDVYERLNDTPGLKNAELIVPSSGKSRIHIEDLDDLAVQTLQGRIIVMDMRSQTQARLQAIYNKVICYNRADLNHFCHTVLIGDGPLKLFHEGQSPDVFRPLLARMRTDCNAAMFFYDPLLHYEHEEKLRLGIAANNRLLQKIPSHLKSGFTGDDAVNVSQIRPYFRAASAKGPKKTEKIDRRQKKLAKLITKKIIEPLGGNGLSNCLTKEGYAIEGEALKLNIYPFGFEQAAAELLEKARASVCL